MKETEMDKNKRPELSLSIGTSCLFQNRSSGSGSHLSDFRLLTFRPLTTNLTPIAFLPQKRRSRACSVALCVLFPWWHSQRSLFGNGQTPTTSHVMRNEIPSK